MEAASCSPVSGGATGSPSPVTTSVGASIAASRSRRSSVGQRLAAARVSLGRRLDEHRAERLPERVGREGREPAVEGGVSDRGDSVRSYRRRTFQPLLARRQARCGGAEDEAVDPLRRLRRRATCRPSRRSRGRRTRRARCRGRRAGRGRLGPGPRANTGPGARASGRARAGRSGRAGSCVVSAATCGSHISRVVPSELHSISGAAPCGPSSR